MTEIHIIVNTIKDLQKSKAKTYTLQTYLAMQEYPCDNMQKCYDTIIEELDEAIYLLNNELYHKIETLSDLPESDKDINDDIEINYSRGRQIGDDYVD